uniref:Uncharacterized protein n=2 Tax=Cyclophora tenuis TaxID=216820 RepID=A0A7S1DE26_CYCTE|mmetsp:Transcript_9932/g.16624  ORF Transcript_9932/g.16624 Transcript_9932/m.16624 type:complete len:122 (+) Transcript_9932:99-464(+)
MLAFVGWYFPQVVGTFNSDDVTTTDPIDAILQADPQWWAQFILLCGVVEALKYKAELDGTKSFTGEGDTAFFDWSNKWAKLDDTQKLKTRRQELKNGRLAMIGVIGLLSDHFIPGSIPLLH